MLRDLLLSTGLIAILRGIQPAEVADIAHSLYAEGLRIIEVPLNTPCALESIRRIREVLPLDCIVGAGTVVSPAQVGNVHDGGGQLIVMPHSDRAVIQSAISAGLEVLPGVATATEAFAALSAGAVALKVFPADHLGPSVLRAWAAVLPAGTGLVPVGGVHAGNLSEFMRAGAIGFGIGSALYHPGMMIEEIRSRARRLTQAWATAKRTRGCQ